MNIEKTDLAGFLESCEIGFLRRYYAAGYLGKGLIVSAGRVVEVVEEWEE